MMCLNLLENNTAAAKKASVDAVKISLIRPREDCFSERRAKKVFRHSSDPTELQTVCQ